MIFIKIIPQLGNIFLISIHPPTSNKFKNSWSINWKMCWVSKFNKFSNIQRLAFQLKLLFYAHIQCASLIFIFLVEKMHSLEDVLFIFGSKIFVIVLHSDWREGDTFTNTNMKLTITITNQTVMSLENCRQMKWKQKISIDSI